MILIIRLLLITLASVGAVSAQTKEQTLAVNVPEGWEFEFKGNSGVEFYVVKNPGENPSLLMFSPWPPPNRVDDIPALMRMLADGFVEGAAVSEEFTLESSDYRIEDFEGDHTIGSFVLFEVEGGIAQTLFMFGRGTDLWNGQFTGPGEDWEAALSIVRSLEPKK